LGQLLVFFRVPNTRHRVQSTGSLLCCPRDSCWLRADHAKAAAGSGRCRAFPARTSSAANHRRGRRHAFPSAAARTAIVRGGISSVARARSRFGGLAALAVLRCAGPDGGVAAASACDRSMRAPRNGPSGPCELTRLFERANKD